MPFVAGQSAVVVPVPAAEPLVGPWRERFDSSAPLGMPAHVTLLFPFLREQRLDDGVVRELAGICAGQRPFEVDFASVGRFPISVHLRPEPANAFRQLTLAIWRRWPEAPPYGGRHETITPHLTVAFSEDETTLRRVEEAIEPGLPLRAHVEEAALYGFDGMRWRTRARLPFVSSAV